MRSVRANSPLTVEGRQRLVERCRTRPIAHVAAEMGISRATRVQVGHTSPRARGPRAPRSALGAPTTTHCDPKPRHSSSRIDASKPEVVSRAYRVRARSAECPRKSAHGQQDLGTAATQPARLHRPEWRLESRTSEDRGGRLDDVFSWSIRLIPPLRSARP